MRDGGRGVCPLHCCRVTLHTLSFSSNYNNPPNMDAVLACCVRSITCICCSCFLQCWQSKKQERKRSDEITLQPWVFYLWGWISPCPFQHCKIKGTRTQKPSSLIRQLIQQSSALVTWGPRCIQFFSAQNNIRADYANYICALQKLSWKIKKRACNGKLHSVSWPVK